MDSITTNKTVQANYTPAAIEKPEGTTTTEPQDTFVPIRPKPEIHSLKDYGNNMADSSKIGFAAGFIKTSSYVEHFMPSYDGLDHFGKHMLAAVPPIIAGVIGGAAGAGAGLVMGIFGRNIGTHISENSLQS